MWEKLPRKTALGENFRNIDCVREHGCHSQKSCIALPEFLVPPKQEGAVSYRLPPRQNLKISHVTTCLGQPLHFSDDGTTLQGSRRAMYMLHGTSNERRCVVHERVKTWRLMCFVRLDPWQGERMCWKDAVMLLEGVGWGRGRGMHSMHNVLC